MRRKTLTRENIILISAILFFILQCGCGGSGSTYQASASIAQTPHAARSSNNYNLAYEIVLSDYTVDNLVLDEVSVYLGDRKTLYKTFNVFTFNVDCLEIEGACLDPAAPGADPLAELASKSPYPIVQMWIRPDADQPPPNKLSHKLAFDVVMGGVPVNGGRIELNGPSTTVDTSDPVVINPPFRGERWTALEATANMVHHRKAFTVKGEIMVPQRFAIDWLQLTEDGYLFENEDMSKLENYPGFGADVLAVASGDVVAALDGVPDNQTPPEKDYEITLENIAGNYILQDIGNGLYALYAHLVEGSVAFSVGDHIQAGRVIGRMGNSGNSDMPHLHFHVCNAPSPLGSDGVPVVYSSFTQVGTLNIYDNLEDPWSTRWELLSRPTFHSREIPEHGAVVTFE